MRTPAGAFLGLGHLVAGRALDNALSSLTTIAGAVADRRDLRDREASAEPGDLQRLSAGECLALLDTRSTGRLAYIRRAGVPDIVPVNYRVHEGAIFVRSGPGPKLQAAERRDLVAFEVDDLDEQTHAGWSVVVTGRAERLAYAESEALGAPAPWANGPRWHTLRIQPQHVEGRRLR